MITRIALVGSFLVTALGLSLPNGAQAQCIGWLCADVQIYVAPPRPRRVVRVVEAPPPPPQVVYVQPSGPPPRVVIMPQQPAPVQYVQQPARVQYVTQPAQRPSTTDGHVGLHASVGSFLSDRIRIGGISGGLRFRPSGRYALDLGVGAYAGTDYNGLDRLEIPATADFLLFFNPQSRFQAYGLVGVGVSWATADGFNDSTNQMQNREFLYAGGQVGLGVEWRITPHVAVNADARAFVRTVVQGDGAPEFVNETTGETTNTSAGGMGTLGATLYF